ncbi:hypothetical protein [Nostoc sp.]|uniref:hypothetical protein n=1 Tax=Nostoc sp. TaxID=1180 RepID=UPI002FF74555
MSHYLHASLKGIFTQVLISTAHRVTTSANRPLVMWNALLRSVTDCGRIQMHVTSFYLSRDLYRQTLHVSTQTLNLYTGHW